MVDPLYVHLFITVKITECITNNVGCKNTVQDISNIIEPGLKTNKTISNPEGNFMLSSCRKGLTLNFKWGP